MTIRQIKREEKRNPTMPNDNLYITGSGSLEQSRTRRGIPDPMIKISGILIIKNVQTDLLCRVQVVSQHSPFQANFHISQKYVSFGLFSQFNSSTI